MTMTPKNHRRLAAWGLSLASLALGAGCADEAPAPESVLSQSDELLGDDLSAEDEAFAEKGSCGTRWSLPSAVASAGRRQRVTYNSADRCTGGASSGALEFGEFLQDEFAASINRRVSGEGIQIYACRSVRGGSSRSVHAEGRAVDFFVPMRSGDANNALGDEVANWLVQNAQQIGIQLIIWDRTVWRAGEGDRCYTGTHPHNDHIHIELNDAAARRETPFFRGGAVTTPGDPGGSSGGVSAWIGSGCATDAECGFTADGKGGKCFLELGGEKGVCTVSCEGYCPDKSGMPTTFCADKRAVGAPSAGGVCLSRAEGSNDACQLAPGTEIVAASRFIGGSGARAATVNVCAPPPGDDGDAVTPSPVEPPADPDERQVLNDVCEAAPEFELSDNGEACSAGQNVWRCACSDRLEAPVSQVCRDGRWLNYALWPRDCGRCQGDYNNGCEEGSERNWSSNP